MTHWPLIGYQDVISIPHLPTEVLSQPQESIHSFGKHSQKHNTKKHNTRIFSTLFPLRPPWCWSCGQNLCDRHQLTPNLPLGWLWVQAHHTPGLGLPASWCWPVSTRHQGQCSWTVPFSWQSPVGQWCLLDTSSSLVSIPAAADSRDTALCQDDQLHQALICESTLLPGESVLHIQASRKSWLIHWAQLVRFTGAEPLQWTGCNWRGCGESVHFQPLLLWLGAEQQGNTFCRQLG